MTVIVYFTAFFSFSGLSVQHKGVLSRLFCYKLKLLLDLIIGDYNTIHSDSIMEILDKVNDDVSLINSSNSDDDNAKEQDVVRIIKTINYILRVNVKILHILAFH